MGVAVPPIGFDDKEAKRKAQLEALRPSLGTPIMSQTQAPPSAPKSTPVAAPAPTQPKPIAPLPKLASPPPIPPPTTQAPPTQAPMPSQPIAPQPIPPAPTTGRTLETTAPPPDKTMTTQMEPISPGQQFDLKPFEPSRPVIRPDPVTPAPSEDMREISDGAPQPQTDMDKAIADLLLGTVNQAGKADTSKDEALINERLGDDVGTALVNQRASMGRSGFGSSGALGAMEGDIQRQARQAALGETLGLRRDEDQRSRDNAFRGIGADIDMREQKENEFFNKELLNAIRSQQGLEPLPDGGGGGLGLNAPSTEIQDIVTGNQQQNETATVGGDVVSAAPPGYDLYQTLSNGDKLYRDPVSGKVVTVKKPAAPPNQNDQREGGNGRRGGG